MKKVLSLAIALALCAISLGGLTALAGERESYVVEIMTTSNKWEMSNETPVGKAIEDKFGIVFKNIYYAGDIREKQSMNLAADEIGEIVYLQYNDMVSAYYNAGVLLCLEDYLDRMPNFTARFADQLTRWRAPTGGQLYKWETNAPNTVYESCELLIRSDVLEFNNWVMPTTASELIDLLERAQQAFPTTVDGLYTVGMTAPFAESWGLQGIASIFYEKGGHYLVVGNEGVTFDWTQDRFVDYFQCPDVKESLQFFNTLYQKGLLDPECFTDYADQTKDKLAGGQALSLWYAEWLANNWQMHDAGLDDYQYIKCFCQLDSQAEKGEPRSFRIDTVRPFNSYALTTACKQPERLIELLDWISTDEGQTLLQCGFEGEHYTVDAQSGKRVPTDALINSTAAEREEQGIYLFDFLPFDISQNSQDGQYFNLLSEQIYKDAVTLTERQKYAYRQMGFDYSMQWGDKHGVFIDTGSAATVALDATSEKAKIQQQMVDCRVKYSAQLIMAESDARFDEIWTAAMNEYDMLDHQSVVDEYNRLYALTK